MCSHLQRKLFEKELQRKRLMDNKVYQTMNDKQLPGRRLDDTELHALLKNLCHV